MEPETLCSLVVKGKLQYPPQKHLSRRDRHRASYKINVNFGISEDCKDYTAEKEGVIASKVAVHAADIAKDIPYARDIDNAMSDACYRVDWEEMLQLAIDGEKARAYFESTPPAERHTCSICGKICTVKTTNMILEGKRWNSARNDHSEIPIVSRMQSVSTLCILIYALKYNALKSKNFFIPPFLLQLP